MSASSPRRNGGYGGSSDSRSSARSDSTIRAKRTPSRSTPCCFFSSFSAAFSCIARIRRSSRRCAMSWTCDSHGRARQIERGEGAAFEPRVPSVVDQESRSRRGGRT
eukprot:31333-Pelagococcus_subviridis.AAC.9